MGFYRLTKGIYQNEKVCLSFLFCFEVTRHGKSLIKIKIKQAVRQADSKRERHTDRVRCDKIFQVKNNILNCSKWLHWVISFAAVKFLRNMMALNHWSAFPPKQVSLMQRHWKNMDLFCYNICCSVSRSKNFISPNFARNIKGKINGDRSKQVWVRENQWFNQNKRC